MSGPRRSTARARSRHFLRRHALAAELVSGLDAEEIDLVVEIGAGRGALTDPLAGLGLPVVAVEIDPWSCAALRRRFARRAAVEVREDDFFDVELPGRRHSVVGNLPFHRTSEILRRITLGANPPREILVIVEKGAALRRAGQPWGKETLTSLGLKPWWHVEIERELARSEFSPPPSVDCAVLRLAHRPRPLLRAGQETMYRDFVARGFGRDGNDVGRSLRSLFSRQQLRGLARDLRFSLADKPSELGLDQWLALFRFFERAGGPRRRADLRGARKRLPRLPRDG